VREQPRFTLRAVADVAGAVAAVVARTVSASLLSSTVLYFAWTALCGVNLLSFPTVLMLLPFVGTIIAAQRFRRSLRRRSARPCGHFGFLVCTAAAMLVSFEWFKNPMHDIALLFGSHGRWGCQVFDAEGNPPLLRDSTVPFLLFPPLLLAAAGHWVATRWVSRS
jgi:hypothetical protein